MFVYEVNVDVHASIAEAYADWLHVHVRQMFDQIEGVERANVCRRDAAVSCPADYEEDEFDNDGGEGPDKAPAWVGYTITYHIRTRAAFADYEQHRASAMRSHAVERFGTKKFRANRRTFELLESVTAAATE